MGSLIHRVRKGFAAALIAVLFAAAPARAAVVYGWGYNGHAQIGDGSATDRHAPVPISTLSGGVTALSGGAYHSLAIKGGALYAWGDNTSGQLGDGTMNMAYVPTALVGTMSSGVTAITGGWYHSLAIRNGGVYGWGNNDYGQLGDGTTNEHHSPVAQTGILSTGVTSIASGVLNGLAIRSGGVYAWGYNADGELGDGTLTDRHAPVALSGTLSGGVTAIAGGVGHSLAIQNGGVYAWGSNTNGQLGDGTTTNHLTPEQIDPTDLHNIVAIAAAEYSSYALSSDGSLWTWGYNARGELGLGNTTDYHTPQHLLPPSGYVFTSISANNYAEYALATVAPTPEPASLSLLALGGIALLRRVRPLALLNGLSRVASAPPNQVIGPRNVPSRKRSARSAAPATLVQFENSLGNAGRNLRTDLRTSRSPFRTSPECRNPPANSAPPAMRPTCFTVWPNMCATAFVMIDRPSLNEFPCAAVIARRVYWFNE